MASANFFTEDVGTKWAYGPLLSFQFEFHAKRVGQDVQVLGFR